MSDIAKAIDKDILLKILKPVKSRSSVKKILLVYLIIIQAI